MNQPRHNPQRSAADALFAAVTRDSAYLRLLVGLLMSVTIFEGYDTTIFHLCTPDIARDFHLGNTAVGSLNSIVRAGGMCAFFIVMYSDRVGRKPIITATVLFYTLFTLLTGLSRGLLTFAIFQSCAQLFLSAEFAVSIIMITEEFSEQSRSSGIGMLNAAGLIGVVAAGVLYQKIVDTGWGWRGMYLIGIMPLLVVAFLRRSLRETARFEALRASRSSAPSRPSLVQTLLRAPNLPSRVQTLLHALEPLRPYLGRVLLVAMLWNCVGLVGGPAVAFFTLYAKRDRHWTSGQIGQAVVLAYLAGAVGHLIAGRAVDRIGRKPTTAAAYLVGAVAIFALFRTTTHSAMLASMIVTVFALQGARTATATYSSELFPTAIRATSYSITVQLLGQISALVAPLIVGALADALGGLGNAVAIVSIGPVIGALIVFIFAPETRDRSLEELESVAAAD